MHEAGLAAQYGWVRTVGRRCWWHRWVASPVLGTEVCRHCNKSPQLPLHFLLCSWAFRVSCPLPTYSQLLSHGFPRLLLICIEMLFQEHTGSNALLHGLLLTALFPFLSPLLFFSLPLSSLLWQGKERKENTSEMKD